MQKLTVFLGIVAVLLVLWIGYALTTLTSRKGTPVQVETESSVITTPLEVTMESQSSQEAPSIVTIEPNFVRPTPINPTHQALFPTYQIEMETIRAMDMVEIPTASVRCAYNMPDIPTCVPEDVWYPGDPTYTVEPQE